MFVKNEKLVFKLLLFIWIYQLYFFFCSVSISLQRLHSNEYTCMYKFPFWQNFTVTVTRYCSVFKVCKLKKEIIRCDEKISHCVRQQKVFNIPNISPKIPTYIPSYS